jgi:hypothetical protein
MRLPHFHLTVFIVAELSEILRYGLFIVFVTVAYIRLVIIRFRISDYFCTSIKYCVFVFQDGSWQIFVLIWDVHSV